MEMNEFGERWNQESSLGNVKFEIPGRHPSGDMRLGDGYTSELSEQDNIELEMRGQSTDYP